MGTDSAPEMAAPNDTGLACLAIVGRFAIGLDEKIDRVRAEPRDAACEGEREGEVTSNEQTGINVKRSQLMTCLLTAVLLVGCSGVVERRWSEEVTLDDGRTLLIDRYVMFSETNSLAGDAYNATDLKSTMVFQKGHEATAVWEAPLVPILLYYDVGTGTWVVVATTSNCQTWYEHEQPVPPYWEYHLVNGKWVQAKLSSGSLGRKTNLFFNYEPTLPGRHLSREIKEQILARHDFSEKYLHVSAELKTNCQ